MDLYGTFVIASLPSLSSGTIDFKSFNEGGSGSIGPHRSEVQTHAL